jgi:hypothetical protein
MDGDVDLIIEEEDEVSSIGEEEEEADVVVTKDIVRRKELRTRCDRLG